MPEDGGSTPSKEFVLDTSSMMYAPQIADPLQSPFENHEVVIPIVALLELDNLKLDPMRGNSAREVIRILQSTFPSKESMCEGVATHGGGRMRIVGANGGSFQLPREYQGNSGDDFILRVAGNLTEAEGKKSLDERKMVILVSKDISLRSKARAAGIEAQDLRIGKVERPQSLAPRIVDIEVPTELIDELYQKRSISIDGLELPFGLHVNACCRLTNPEGTKHALGIYVPGERIVVVHKNNDKGRKGVSPRNAEQLFAYNLVMRSELLVNLFIGKAGTGKTLMALKAGIELLSIPEAQINRIICFRPMIEIGTPLGFLPGSSGEKFAPWGTPIYSNLDLLFPRHSDKNGNDEENENNGHEDKHTGNGNGSNGDVKKLKRSKQPPDPREKLSRLLETGVISVRPFTFVRGTTFSNALIIVDEAQNLTPHQLKAVLTRAGDCSRIVVTGDLTQIDDPKLDASSCGLAKALERMRGHAEFAAIELVKGERSRLATLVSELFIDL
ncbi:PhoH family protein [Candidatus Campbellbacteria bacterium]|nr:MAG: PhoH family protein [Candidatus Campbellbacteria bacterium]